MLTGLLILILSMLPCTRLVPWLDGMDMPRDASPRRSEQPQTNDGNPEAYDGTWDVVILNWVKPATTPLTGKALAHATLRMGGHYLMVEVSGQLGGRPIEGLFVQGLSGPEGTPGAIWIDNLSCHPNILQATPGQEGFSWTTPWSFPGAEHLKSDTFRTVRISEGNYLFQRFRTLPDGSCFKTLECQCERRPPRPHPPNK